MVRPQISLAGYGHLLLVLLGSSGSFKSRGLIRRYWAIGAVPLKGILDPGPFLFLCFLTAMRQQKALLPESLATHHRPKALWPYDHRQTSETRTQNAFLLSKLFTSSILSEENASTPLQGWDANANATAWREPPSCLHPHPLTTQPSCVLKIQHGHIAITGKDLNRSLS